MKFYRSRSFSFWMAAGSALFVACSVWIIGKSYRSEGMGSFDFFMGVSGGAFFLLTAFFWLCAAMHEQPDLDFSPEGLIVLDFATQRIPWGEITGAAVYMERMVRLEIQEAFAQKLNRTWVAKIQGLFYGKAIFFIATSGMGLSPAKLVALIKLRGAD